MMERNKISELFYIEEHATLYALLAKHTIEKWGDRGMSAVEEATQLYGLERGGRMAKRALRDGKELSMMNYTQYSEWVDSKGESAGRIESYHPDYTTITTRCGWCEAWKKHGLLEYGKIYCRFIDEFLVKGFNPANRLILTKTLSASDDCCHFCWVGASFKDEQDYIEIRKEKKAMVKQNTKDFLYHTGHLLSAFSRQLTVSLGDEAAFEIVSAAMQDFAEIFGNDKALALFIESTVDFHVI